MKKKPSAKKLNLIKLKSKEVKLCLTSLLQGRSKCIATFSKHHMQLKLSNTTIKIKDQSLKFFLNARKTMNSSQNKEKKEIYSYQMNF